MEDALDDRNDLVGPKKPSAGEAGGKSRGLTSQASAAVPGRVCPVTCNSILSHREFCRSRPPQAVGEPYNTNDDMFSS